MSKSDEAANDEAYHRYNKLLAEAEVLNRIAYEAAEKVRSKMAEAHRACPECKSAGGDYHPEDPCPLCGLTVFDSADAERYDPEREESS